MAKKIWFAFSIVMVIWGMAVATIMLFSPDSAVMEAPEKKTSVKAEILEKEMTGKWIGTLEEDVIRTNWVIERFDDGKYEVHFSIIEDQKEKETFAHKGFWSVSDGIYFTTATHENYYGTGPITKEIYMHKAYWILALDEDEFTYQGLHNGVIYTVKRAKE